MKTLQEVRSLFPEIEFQELSARPFDKAKVSLGQEMEPCQLVENF